MFGIDPKAARVTWTAALTLLLLATAYAIRRTLIVFAIALLLAYLLSPLVDQIGSRFPARSRTPALALTYLVVIGALIALAVGIGSRVAFQARQLLAHPPDVPGYLRGLRRDYPVFAPTLEALEDRMRQQLGELASAVPRFGMQIVEASTNLIDLIVIPILSFFILKDGADIRDGFLAVFPSGARRAEARRTIAEIHDLLLQYMRALFLLCATVLVVYSLVLSVIGVEYALLLSSIAFLCEFVPVVGPLTSVAVILAVSALSRYPHLLWLVAFLGSFRILQDYVISPRLMSRGVELHPIWVIFGVYAGAEIGGVAGVFLSVPTLALARLLVSKATDKSS